MSKQKEKKQPPEVFFVTGYLSDDVASELISEFYHSHSVDETAPWEVLINSEGGDLSAGSALFSVLRAFSLRGGGSHEVTTCVRGQAASCAALVLQAGDWRTAGVMDFLMIHEPLISFEDQFLSAAKTELKQASDWTANMVKVFIERINVSSDVFMSHFKGQDWWMDSAEAFSYGIIDEIKAKTVVPWVVSQ